MVVDFSSNRPKARCFYFPASYWHSTVELRLQLDWQYERENLWFPEDATGWRLYCRLGPALEVQVGPSINEPKSKISSAESDSS